MSKPELFQRVREEIKHAVRLLLEQIRRDHPNDRVYAILLEVGVRGTYVIRVAGSEESLSRLAEKYAAKGYRVKSGDLIETLRATLRWDAPGDDRAGWYWGNEGDDTTVTELLERAVQDGIIVEYDDTPHLRESCLGALRELDTEGAFGTGPAREQVLVGICCCEEGFPSDEAELAGLNPPKVIARLRRELQLAAAADDLLIRPWGR